MFVYVVKELPALVLRQDRVINRTLVCVWGGGVGGGVCAREEDVSISGCVCEEHVSISGCVCMRNTCRYQGVCM
jgi:hypothetical protein